MRRRDVLVGSGAAAAATLVPGLGKLEAIAASRPTVSPTDFGARLDPAIDNTGPVQAAIDAVQRLGGGTVLISGRYRCGKIVISGHDIRLEGKDGWLVDGRLVIKPEARNIEVANLGLIDTTGTGSYLLDLYGRDCSFRNLELIKEPAAAGYQMYVRQPSARCRFDGLRLRGANGIFLAGAGHSFENFVLESKAVQGRGGGDDAFAIKAVGAPTQNIVIRGGTVRGFAAIVSFGSEIGSRDGVGPAGAVRNVVVENVIAERCSRIAFVKPGALKSDWRNGTVEGVRLRNLSLIDATGEQFRTGIQFLAGRGATVRDIEASGISIVGRARDSGTVRTAAISMTFRDNGAPATIRDIRLQVKFTDPHGGAAHGPRLAGYPVDRIVSISKNEGSRAAVSNIVLDVEGSGTSMGGIAVSSGLDGAVIVRSAVLKRIGEGPSAATDPAVLFSNSRLTLGQVNVELSKLPKFGGSAFRSGG